MIARYLIGSGLALVMAMVPWTVVDASEEMPGVPNHPALTDDLVVTLGVFYPRSTTTAALGGPGGGSGVLVNFEDALDLEARSVVPNFGVFWRANERWRVELQYFDVSREATRTLASDIEWGDTTYPVGTTVDSSFDFSDIRLSAAYSFFRRPDKEMGGGVGLHVSGIEGAIASSGLGKEAADVTAPLPVINLYGMFALTDEWAMTIRGDWLSLTYDHYSGDVRNLETTAIYQPAPSFGVGVGMRSMLINVDIDDDDWRGQARLAFQGPMAFVTMSF